jgi:VanZ family protein
MMSNSRWFLNLPGFIFWIVMLVMTILFLVPQQFVSSPIFDWWDKAQHTLAFGVLMLLGFLAYPRAFWKLAIALILYGVAIEVIQSLTGWRSGEVLDAVADRVGIVLSGVLIQGHGFWRRSQPNA